MRSLLTGIGKVLSSQSMTRNSISSPPYDSYISSRVSGNILLASPTPSKAASAMWLTACWISRLSSSKGSTVHQDILSGMAIQTSQECIATQCHDQLHPIKPSMACKQSGTPDSDKSKKAKDLAGCGPISVMQSNRSVRAFVHGSRIP